MVDVALGLEGIQRRFSSAIASIGPTASTWPPSATLTSMPGNTFIPLLGYPSSIRPWWLACNT